MIKAFIFDLDGTLANTLEDLKTSMNAMLSKFDFPLMTIDDILKNINCGALEFVTKCMPKETQSDKKMVETCFVEYNKQYSLHYIEKTCLYDGIMDCLDALKKSGMKLAVLSNKQDSFTKKIISTLVGDGIFDTVMGHIEEFPHKPDPKSALFIADKFGRRLKRGYANCYQRKYACSWCYLGIP